MASLAAFTSPFHIPTHTSRLPQKSPRRPSYRTPHHSPVCLQTGSKTKTSEVATVDVFNGRPVAPRRLPAQHPVIILPGYGADVSDYQPMATLLREQLGAKSYVTVVPVRSFTWVSTVGGRPVTAILNLLDTSVQRALEDTGAERVHIVAHSAAGWISRIYLGDHPYPPEPAESGRVWAGAKFVKTLLCLGTPHRSAEPVTLKNMTFVNDRYPHAFHSEVMYVNIAGDGGSVPAGDEASPWRFWDRDWIPRISYGLTDKATVGKAVSGDGIIPLSVAFLQNAAANVRMKGVWHSPSSTGPWYGHPQVVKYWCNYLK